jgi:23S rRNA pseudouridine1911/1915/1917 synthase
MGKALAPINPLRPGIVHRLDKETSGVMVVAKTNRAYLHLMNQFRTRTTQKEYRAIVWGIVKQDKLTVDMPIARDEKNRLKMRISFVEAKSALTEVTVLQRFKEASYLSLNLKTGRMHQIRVHMRFLGCPIVGDKKYGINDSYKELFLHAFKLGFHHPITSEFMEFNAPLPEWFERFIEKA